MSNPHFGIVNGLDAVGVADDLLRRLKEHSAEVLLEGAAFPVGGDCAMGSSLSERKIRVFNAIQTLAKEQVDLVLLPCFLCHTFLDEIEEETTLQIVDMMAALHNHLVSQFPRANKIGILTSGFVRDSCLFERYFPEENWRLLYPDEEQQYDCTMSFLSVPEKNHSRSGEVISALTGVCSDLVNKGAEVIIPASAQFLMLTSALQKRGFPIVDINAAYVEYALSKTRGKKAKPFKIGVVGGVGPAATVDFVNKIVNNTPASRDQEHIKLVVEQNPQIPDRTANLLNGGTDPTLALYSACKRLEADDASIIAIPCNTAHAFVERLQPHLSIPIVNMLRETVEYIKTSCGDRKTVGLLATNGTISSRVYHDVITPAGFEVRVPDEENQQRVMRAIYGPKGVKAGYTQGECTEDLLRALTSLVDDGAEIIVLGCTELPLLISENERFAVGGKTVTVLDPTAILARKCIALAGRSQEN